MLLVEVVGGVVVETTGVNGGLVAIAPEPVNTTAVVGYENR